VTQTKAVVAAVQPDVNNVALLGSFVDFFKAWSQTILTIQAFSFDDPSVSLDPPAVLGVLSDINQVIGIISIALIFAGPEVQIPLLVISVLLGGIISIIEVTDKTSKVGDMLDNLRNSQPKIAQGLHDMQNTQASMRDTFVKLGNIVFSWSGKRLADHRQIVDEIVHLQTQVSGLIGTYNGIKSGLNTVPAGPERDKLVNALVPHDETIVYGNVSRHTFLIVLIGNDFYHDTMAAFLTAHLTQIPKAGVDKLVSSIIYAKEHIANL